MKTTETQNKCAGKMPLWRLLAIIVIFLFSPLVKGQITIGSDIDPKPGTLLDLQEYLPDGNNTNAIRGLLLPRVALTDKKSLTDISSLTSSDNIPHTALIVYATERFGSPVNCPGPYAWNGTEWISLRNNEHPDITMTDADGNTYNAKWYTTDPCDPAAGSYWMTQDLYSTVAGDGSKLPGAGKDEWPMINYAYQGSTQQTPLQITSKTDLLTGTISYGWGLTAAAATNNNTTVSRLEYAQMFGLKYSREQAMVACPTGWHLATPAEWKQLADALGGAGTAGSKMRSKYGEFFKAADITEKKKWGPTSLLEDSGFGALPGGHTGADSEWSRQFANAALWWMDDPTIWPNGAQSVAYDCRLVYNSDALLFDTSSTSNTNTGNVRRGLSVRCVQDKN
ncbi:hypothetical protein D0T84_21100 [Dysgonomonas sp. 521]|uniref:FISUMP domain-containing protein n=1 Tax=Dysgonomonas sp. 521 TaxID=2302932 RepID=UPI0013D61428|nr:FISUMP domain-containing protein [Dysgonomonas sp. 521]NDV97375.1 hypothetical protein [Dysgonomonas sp. 521]